MSKQDKQFLGWNANLIVGAIFLASGEVIGIVAGAFMLTLASIVLMFGFDL